MDWRSIPGFMPQAIPTMQQTAYTTPTPSGSWASTTHAGTLAFQQHHPNVTLPSQTVSYSNGFGGTQQFKKSMVPGVQFGRPLHAAYAQAPMPIVHRKGGMNSSLLSSHDAGGHHGDMDGLHSLVSVKSEASDIIEVHWESKGRGFPSNVGSHGGPAWLQGPGRVTIKSEPIDVENNPWDTAKSIPAFPTNLSSAENANWHHQVSEVSSVPSLTGAPHYSVGFSQDVNRGSCSKKDLAAASASLPLGLPPYAGANIGLNHGMVGAGAKNMTNMSLSAANAAAAAAGANMMGAADQASKADVKCNPMDGSGGAGSAGGGQASSKKKKEKKGPPIPCKQCGKEFSKSYMKKHIRQHAEMKPFVCPTCNKVFYSAPLLSEHQSAYHDEEKKHQCYVCGHRFHQKSLLKEHLKTHVEKPYKCRVCPRSFSRRIKLNNHEKLHEGAQLKQCDICGKLLKGRVSLKCHMHNMHSDTRKKYPCLDCGRIFLLERSLTTHRYVVHTGERPFKCPDCGRAFADIKYLKSHLLIHTGEKPYQCNVCGKRFRQSTALWCHKTTHTGIKPHRCPDCGRQSVHRSELAKHKCSARRDQQPPPSSETAVQQQQQQQQHITAEVAGAAPPQAP